MSESKRNKAVALKYNLEEDIAPVVVAAGYGDVARRIVDVAEKQGIPVFRDDSTASLLCMLDIGRSIPEELYQVVAAIYCQLVETAHQIRGLPTGEVQPPSR
jgi:flagellar biosynthesis protein